MLNIAILVERIFKNLLIFRSEIVFPGLDFISQLICVKVLKC